MRNFVIVNSYSVGNYFTIDLYFDDVDHAYRLDTAQMSINTEHSYLEEINVAPHRKVKEYFPFDIIFYEV